MTMSKKNYELAICISLGGDVRELVKQYAEVYGTAA